MSITHLIENTTTHMKQLIFKAIACCTILLPLSTHEAKTYGGFKPDDTFTLKLDYRTSIKQVGIVITDPTTDPSRHPEFQGGIQG